MAQLTRQHGISAARGAGYRAAFHPASQTLPECLHRVLQPDLSRRGSERMTVRLVGGGAGDHHRMARALQRNRATRCAGKPAASALPRAFTRRGNFSLELSTRRRSLRTIRYDEGEQRSRNARFSRYEGISILRIWLEQNDQKTARAGPVRGGLRR